MPTLTKSGVPSEMGTDNQATLIGDSKIHEESTKDQKRCYWALSLLVLRHADRSPEQLL